MDLVKQGSSLVSAGFSLKNNYLFILMLVQIQGIHNIQLNLPGRDAGGNNKVHYCQLFFIGFLYFFSSLSYFFTANSCTSSVSLSWSSLVQHTLFVLIAIVEMSPVACKLYTTQTDPPTPKSFGLLGTTFPISEYMCTSGMLNLAAAALSCLPAEKAIQKSGIWRHLFLSRCDQSGDLLLCFNSEVKGACGMRMGIVCVCVCV